VNVLFLHPAASFGGASKSLCELAAKLVSPEVALHVICPSGGASSAFEAAGLRVQHVRGLSQLDNTLYGHYRGLRWLVLLRELALLPFSVSALFAARRGGRFDLIHINEITLLPLGLIAKKLLGIPLVVHVRSLQHRKGWVSAWVARRLSQDAAAVIAIDETVKRTLPVGLAVNVIHNGLDVSPPSSPINPHVFRVGIVGLLLKLKGVYEFVEAARILLNERGMQAEFWIVGENARSMLGLRAWLFRKLDFARDVHKELRELIAEHGIGKSVLLKGFQANVQSVYRELDLLCFPSHLNAAGRPVFEAAFFGLPSIVAVRDAPDDAIIHGHTGLCIDEPDPVALANAIVWMYLNPAERERMGRNANKLAHTHFDITRNAQEVLAVYRRILNARSDGGRSKLTSAH
jgi:glycosyltransferase involved in cell wall biosynthesis